MQQPVIVRVKDAWGASEPQLILGVLVKDVIRGVFMSNMLEPVGREEFPLHAGCRVGGELKDVALVSVQKTR